MTGRSKHIGLWFSCLFSMSIVVAQPQKSVSDTTTIKSGKLPAPRAPLGWQMIFTTPFLGDALQGKSETFCIFRNLGFNAVGINQTQITHASPRWRCDYEYQGSVDWANHSALLHYGLKIHTNHHIAAGLGVMKTAGYAMALMINGQQIASPLAQLNYQHKISRVGTVIYTLRSTIAPNPQNPMHQLLRAIKNAPINTTREQMSWSHRFQFNQFQALWLSIPKKSSHTGMIKQTFARFGQSPQAQLLEVGVSVNHPNQWGWMAAINTTNQPIRVGIFKSKTSWRAGMEVQWQQQLGCLFALQCRYNWQ